LSAEELKQIYKDLGKNAEDIFGTEKEFLKSIEDTKKIVKAQNKAMETSMRMMFGDGATLP
jgi:arsenate reductase-like glutaredoxin family protein